MKRIFEALITALSLLLIGAIGFMSVQFITNEQSDGDILVLESSDKTVAKESYVQTLEAYGTDKEIKVKEESSVYAQDRVTIVAKPEITNDDIVSKIDSIVQSSLK